MMHLFLEEHHTIYYIARNRFLLLKLQQAFFGFKEKKKKKIKYTEIKFNGSLTKFARARRKPFKLN